jgi:hypothetical protein
MSTAVTMFWVRFPSQDSLSVQNNVDVNTFKSNIGGLGAFTTFDAAIEGADGIDHTCMIMYGALSTAQDTTALGFLNTLNTALGSEGRVQCLTLNANTQP